jgi:hypothetical protein
MGSVGHVSHLLYQKQINGEKANGEEIQKKLF